MRFGAFVFKSGRAVCEVSTEYQTAHAVLASTARGSSTGQRAVTSPDTIMYKPVGGREEKKKKEGEGR
eukprot:1822764-Rhodomonas_salina.1